MDDSLAVRFPLRGEWAATTTPADRVPSHGNHLFGQTYAYDFARLGRTEDDVGRVPLWAYFIFGAPTKSFYSFGEPVHSVLDGEVVVAVDAELDRKWMHPARDFIRKWQLIRQLKAGRRFDLKRAIGNHVVTFSESHSVYAVYAHLRGGSLCVRKGDRIAAGQQVGEVGTTGNSTGPHLHFHLMDSIRFDKARGVPCCFETIEALEDGNWSVVERAVPGLNAKVRFRG